MYLITCKWYEANIFALLLTSLDLDNQKWEVSVWGVIYWGTQG